MTELYFFLSIYWLQYVRTDCILNSSHSCGFPTIIIQKCILTHAIFVSEFYCLRNLRAPGFVTHGNIMERTKTDMKRASSRNAFLIISHSRLGLFTLFSFAPTSIRVPTIMQHVCLYVWLRSGCKNFGKYYLNIQKKEGKNRGEYEDYLQKHIESLQLQRIRWAWKCKWRKGCISKIRKQRFLPLYIVSRFYFFQIYKYKNMI